MKRFALLPLLALALPVLAGNTLPKERTTDTAAHACREATAADGAQLKWTVFAAANVGRLPANVVCGAPIDIGRPGTVAFGAWLNNQSGKTWTVTCAGSINTGGDGPVNVTRSVMLSPGEQARIQWTAADIGRATLDGGQAGMVCTLPPGLRLKWVYTVGVDN